MAETEDNTLGVVWGAPEIAQLIGRTERQTFHLLSTGVLPARKVGGRWCASRKALERFFGEEDAA